MIYNAEALLFAMPIKGMVNTKIKEHGVSYGLGEAGYDIRIAQTIRFTKDTVETFLFSENEKELFSKRTSLLPGKFVLASAMEEFNIPTNLVGIVHDKSTWARQGLSVFNTVIEPGWKGFLTLELVYHGYKDLIIPAGSGIAQVVFHETKCNARYEGKYQNQENKPVPSKFE